LSYHLQCCAQYPVIAGVARVIDDAELARNHKGEQGHGVLYSMAGVYNRVYSTGKEAIYKLIRKGEGRKKTLADWVAS